MPIDQDINFDELANLTEGFSGAELALICWEAGMLAITANLNT